MLDELIWLFLLPWYLYLSGKSRIFACILCDDSLRHYRPVSAVVVFPKISRAQNLQTTDLRFFFRASTIIQSMCTWLGQLLSSLEPFCSSSTFPFVSVHLTIAFKTDVDSFATLLAEVAPLAFKSIQLSLSPLYRIGMMMFCRQMSGDILLLEHRSKSLWR